MNQLELKFLQELSKDAIVVACRFKLPNLVPIKIIEDGVDSVWVYKMSD